MSVSKVGNETTPLSTDPPVDRTNLKQKLRSALFDLYLVATNQFLRVPGHSIRLLILRHFCGWVIGPRTSIERRVRVTTKGGVTVGSGCVIDGNVLLDGRGTLTIGDLVNISHDAVCLTADHDPDSSLFEGRRRPVVIGSRCWIATRAIVLPGAEIGEGAVIGAGSVAVGQVPSWTISVGAPARVLRPRDVRAQQSLPRYRRWFH